MFNTCLLFLVLLLFSCSNEPSIGTGETIPNFIRGSVVYKEIKVANVDVELKEVTINDQGDSVIFNKVVKTDENGQFIFEGINHASYFVSANYQDLGAFRKNIKYNKDSLDILPLYLSKKVSVQGHLFDNVGECNVIINGMNVSSKVSSEGDFTLNNVVAGNMDIVFKDNRDKIFKIDVTINSQEEPITLLDFSLKETTTDSTNNLNTKYKTVVLTPKTYAPDSLPEWYSSANFGSVSYNISPNYNYQSQFVSESVFPGAIGYASTIKAGRFGRVIRITSLDDSGPGTLREALESEGPRTVIFNVSGEIKLIDQIRVSSPYLTVAGQTSSKGITITGCGINIYTNDVLLRYLAIRPGEAYKRHAIWINNAKKVYIDHCSVSWAVSENFSVTNSDSITIANCINSNPLFNSTHYDTPRSITGYISGSNISIVNNIFSSAKFLGPVIDSGSLNIDIQENIFFNWVTDAIWSGVNSKINIVNNLFKPSAATMSKKHSIFVTMSDSLSEIYINGNYHTNTESLNSDNRLGLYSNYPTQILSQYSIGHTLNSNLSSQSLINSISPNVGANIPYRDNVDTRVIDELISGELSSEDPSFKSDTNFTINDPTLISGIIDFPKDNIERVEAIDTFLDSDGDGLDDSYEISNGLDPFNNLDANTISKNGYTWVEKYINSFEK